MVRKMLAGVFVLALSLAAQPSRGRIIVNDEGVDLPIQPRLNFIGPGITCVNNAGTGKIDCTISIATFTGSLTGDVTSAAMATTLATYVPKWVKHTVAYTNDAFKAAATTVTAAVFTLPANGVIQGVRLKHSVAYAGTAVTSVSCSLGDGTDATAYSPAHDSFIAVSNTAQTYDGGAYSTTAAEQTVTLSCTANVNFGSGAATILTAGSLDVHVFWATLP